MRSHEMVNCKPKIPALIYSDWRDPNTHSHKVHVSILRVGAGRSWRSIRNTRRKP